MSGSGEDSPDPEWLSSYKVPNHSAVTLSSDSEASENESGEDSDQLPISRILGLANRNKVDGSIVQSEAARPIKSDLDPYSDQEQVDEEEDPAPSQPEIFFKRKKSSDDRNTQRETGESSFKKKEPQSIWMLSSDSETSPAKRMRKGTAGRGESIKLEPSPLKGKSHVKDLSSSDGPEESPSKRDLKGKALKEQLDAETAADDETETEMIKDVELVESLLLEKTKGPPASSSRLPLMLSEKVQRSKALVECEGDSIDLSGDMGAVGRVMIQESVSGDPEIFLDLKGTIYKTSIIPCRTFCVVSFGQTEAKIEAIMNDFIQLSPQSNIHEAETMVEGTLEGFSFESDDEADKIPKVGKQHDEKPDTEEPAGGKAKRKSEKSTWIGSK
ncbi:hypothetical protein MLD38_025748 [Melastoma candidum]|uniref:Uncharacterized protein n=1 Tax=Melastoma candidum TaxID=119954 RepID=A0ACB9NW32_9MYRT|nr:hypothetical protein MLD38_025748 [Melastoma candidum]